MVLQGDVERILNENSKQMTCAFEKYSKSGKLKKQYDSAQLALKNEMNKFTEMLKKKREAVNQKRTLDTRKNEAGKFMELKTKINEKSRDAHLLKLRLIEIESNSISSLATNLSEELNDIKSQLRNLVNVQSNKKSDAAKHFRRMTLMERQLSDAELEYQKIKPMHSNMQTKIEFLKSKINSESKSMGILDSQKISSMKRITELENSLTEARSLLNILEQPPTQQISKNLSPEEYEKYLKLRDKADKNTQADQISLNNLYSERESLLKQIGALNSSIVQFEKRLNIIKESETSLLSRLDKIKITHAKYNEISREKKVAIELISKEIEDAKTIKLELQLKLDNLNDQLSNYKIDMNDLERQKKLNDVTDKLKLLFNGVHGKLIDLITPVHKRYHVAITKVIGRNIDAIVVDDQKIAFDCIEYLKQQQIGRFIFLPLKSLNPKPIKEKLRLLGGSSKLLIDTVKLDPVYNKIACFIFGNTIFCDDLDEALRLSVGLNERRKTVCIDGTLFLKNGIISGGSRNLARKAQRWNDKKVSDLKSERQNLNNLIQAKLEIINKQKLLDELEMETKTINQNAHVYNSELAQLESSLAKLQQESTEIKSFIKDNSLKLSNFQEDLRTRNSTIDELENKIKAEKLLIFAKFINRNNIKNFEEFESGSIKSMRELMNRRITCQKHIDILANQLNYEKSQININKKESVEQIIEENKNELAQCLKEIGKIDEELKFFSDKIEKLKSDLAGYKNLQEKAV